MNNKGVGSKSKCELKCCNAGDYYIKHTGYKYYSVEACGKIEVKGVSDTFMAYKYTDGLNDSLIGQKQKLPYGFCYNKNMFLAVSDNVVEEGESVYRGYQCGERSKCNSNYEGLCILNDVSIDENNVFDCVDSVNIDGAVSIKYENKTIATCPTGTELKIKDENGSWSACKGLKFKLNQARCVPKGIQGGLSSAAAK